MKFFAPESLRIRKQWLVWKYEQDERDPKPRKVPYYSNGKKRYGTQGAEHDREQLVDHETALKAIESGKYTGIGFAFLPDDGLIGIDLDKMRDATTGELNERASKIVKACDSYTEVSPSGTGIHIIVEGKTVVDRHVDVGMEVFCGSQFFCWTGDKIGANDDVKPIKPQVLETLHKTIAFEREKTFASKAAANDNKPATKPREYNSPSNDNDPQRTLHLTEKALSMIPPDVGYDDWLHIGMALQSEFADDGLEMWDEWSRNGSKYCGRRDMEAHWRSFRGDGRKIGTLFHIAKGYGFEFPKRERPAPKERPKRDERANTVPTENRPAESAESAQEATARERVGFWDIVRPLGYDRETKFFYSSYSKQVRGLTPSQMNKHNLIELAPLDLWRETFHAYENERKIEWDQAADALIERCNLVGIFNPEKVRGRGCWMDEGRTILHLGDRIICESKPYLVHKFPSAHIYEFTRSMPGPGDEEITQEELNHLIDLSMSFRWEMGASALLLAGWAALAPVCGSLKWRPHIWLSGGTGSGKTTILNDYLKPLMAGIELMAQGNSTEAGIRQRLRSDALPVLFDEAEQNDDKERARIQSILALARQASSESAAKTLKGNQTGDGAEYHIRSMFAWAAIQAGIKMQADDTRIVVLNLKSLHRDPKNTELGKQQAQEWEDLKKRLARVSLDNLGPKLMVRTMRLMPMIHEAIKVFVRVCTEKHGTQRLGDTYGTLLAGYWSMEYDHVPTIEEARDLVNDYSWDVYTEDAHDDESIKAISSMMLVQVNYRPRVDGGVNITRSLGELIDIVTEAQKEWQMADVVEEVAVLAKYGMKIDKDRLIIANNGDLMEKALKDKPWGTKWKSYIERLPGAQKMKTMYFTKGVIHRATSIPISVISHVAE